MRKFYINNLSAFILFHALSIASSQPVFPPEYNLADEKLLLGIALDDMERVEVAFADGARLEAEFSKGGNRYYTPLQLAVVMGRTAMVEDFLKRGAKVEDTGKGFAEPVMILAATQNQPEILRVLIPQVRDLSEERTKMFRTAFERALVGGHLEVARVLVQAGLDPKTGQYAGDTKPGAEKKTFWLQEAAEHGDPVMVEYLVEECGLSPDQGVESNWQGSPLFSAAMWGNVEVVRYLIARGADINAPAAGRYNHSGYSPLAIALRYGRLDCVRVLLEAGANTSAKDVKFSSILQADLAGYKEFVEHFEARGLKSPLWELWQEAQAEERVPEVVDPVATRTGLAAQLLEGEWPSPASEASAPAAERPVRVGILSGSGSGPLADLLTAELSGLSSLELVERDEMDRIIAEHQLNRAGLFEGEALSTFARLVAADALIMVSTEEVDGDELHRFRWIDARCGLLLGIRYAPEKKSTWPEFAQRYRDYLREAVKELREANFNKIPVSLVGIHANRATAEAAHLEREAALALQFALSKQKPFILLERESLQQLVRESRIAGETTHGFQASGMFIKARVDVDATTGKLQQIVLQATAPDGSEIASLQREASGVSLPAACMALAAELTAEVNASTNAKDAESAGASIASDREVMADEAYWLYRVGLHQQALAVMENAMALGADRPGDWKLYLAILDKEAERLRKNDSLADTKFRHLLRVEFERILSLEAYFEALQGAGDKRFGKKINFDADDSIEGFSLSLHQMGSVTLQRRYAEELRELQDRFVRIFNQSIRPILSGEASVLREHFSNSEKRSLRNACIWIAPRLGFQDGEAIESILAASLSGNHDAYWRYLVAPPPRLGGSAALSQWIREHGNNQSFASYYAARADGHHAAYDPLAPSHDALSKINGRGEIRVRNWNKQKLQEELDSFLNRPSSPDVPTSVNSLLSGPLLETWTVKDQNVECRTVEAQRADAEHFQYLASHRDAEVYEESLPNLRTAPGRIGYLEKITDPVSARMQLKAGRALLSRLQSKDDGDPEFISKYESFLVGLEGRLDTLDAGRQSTGPEIETVSATYWDHVQFLPDGVNHIYFYPVNSSESLIYHDEAWWTFGIVKQNGAYRICAFRIDDHTLETEVKTFRTPGKGRMTNQDVQFIVLSGAKIIIGTDTEEGTLVLDWQSGETATVPGFKACLFQEGRNWVRNVVHGGEVYYTAVPDYERNPYQARMNSLVFLELDPVTLEQKVLFNFRRNPPETPLDKPVESKYSNKGFDVRFSESEGVFGFVHSGKRYVFDPANSEFAEISSADFRKIDRSALEIVNTWPTHHGKSDWYRFIKDGYEGLELGDAVPLALVDRKNDDAVAVIGLEFQNAPGVDNPPSDAFKAAIRARERSLRFYGYSSKHAVLRADGQGIAFIKYEDLEPALEKE